MSTNISKFFMYIQPRDNYSSMSKERVFIEELCKKWGIEKQVSTWERELMARKLIRFCDSNCSGGE